MLHVVNEHLRIPVEQDTRIEQPLRVNNLFRPPHPFINGFAPFCLDEGSHVATCAMLGFQATVVSQHCLHQLTHEIGILLDALRGVDVGEDGEMDIAIQQVSPHHGITITITAEYLPHSGQGLTQYLLTESDVFNDGNRSSRTLACCRSEKAATYPPIGGVQLWIGGEGDGIERRDLGQGGLDLVELLLKGILIV